MTIHTVPGLDHSVELWSCAIGAGVVVIACVLVLLLLLTTLVGDIERHLRAAAHAAKGISEDVEDSVLIDEAARLIHDLGTELELQVGILASISGEAV